MHRVLRWTYVRVPAMPDVVVPCAMTELDAMVAADPYDDDAWTVFEDALLEHDDLRAPLVRLEQAKRSTVKAIAERGKQLLGPSHRALLPRLRGSRWRAGYLQDLRFAATDTKELEQVARLLASPAARLVRSIEVKPRHIATVGAIVRMLAGSPCVRSLRRLAFAKPQTVFGGITIELGTSLAPFTLDHVSIATSRTELAYTPNLARLQTLRFPLGRLDVSALFVERGFPELRELQLLGAKLDPTYDPQVFARELATTLVPRVAPKLEVLRVDAAVHSFA